MDYSSSRKTQDSAFRLSMYEICKCSSIELLSFPFFFSSLADSIAFPAMLQCLRLLTRDIMSVELGGGGAAEDGVWSTSPESQLIPGKRCAWFSICCVTRPSEEAVGIKVTVRRLSNPSSPFISTTSVLAQLFLDGGRLHSFPSACLIV